MNNLSVPVLAEAAKSNHTPRDHSASVNDSIGDEARESINPNRRLTDKPLKPDKDSRGAQNLLTIQDQLAYIRSVVASKTPPLKKVKPKKPQLTLPL